MSIYLGNNKLSIGNIKTVNNQSLEGTGNITIAGEAGWVDISSQFTAIGVRTGGIRLYKCGNARLISAENLGLKGTGNPYVIGTLPEKATSQTNGVLIDFAHDKARILQVNSNNNQLILYNAVSDGSYYGQLIYFVNEE